MGPGVIPRLRRLQSTLLHLILLCSMLEGGVQFRVSSRRRLHRVGRLSSRISLLRMRWVMGYISMAVQMERVSDMKTALR